jgi:hypothetical protein
MSHDSTQTHPPLYHLISQIMIAVENGLHLIAVNMAVALPDICAALRSENGETTGRKYQNWCNENLPKEKFSYLSPSDLYRMRCTALHTGRYGGGMDTVARVIFSIPNPQGNTFTDCRLNDAYFYSVVDFCRNLCQATAVWYENHKHDPIVVANSARMVQYHMNGIAPYVSGSPVIG